ncbi:H1_5 [Mytilus coruscus]|uniref:H1_5 n=1 Tax=Mytilus coruscus TaxID=42192 RepID=A0A6J8D6G6_MYTCO|nr:H1_5 [Mytilus coruscus]
MSDAPVVVKTPAKSPKKKAAAKPKKVATHPKYSEMVGKAISALKERGGSSRQAILKYIIANFNVGSDAKTVNTQKLALKSGVKSNSLKQSKGTGASGSFKIGEVAKPAKKPAKKAVKPKAAKPKKAKTPKKTATKTCLQQKNQLVKRKQLNQKAKKPATKKPAAKPAAKSAKKATKSPKNQRLQLNQRRQRPQRRSKWRKHMMLLKLKQPF